MPIRDQAFLNDLERLKTLLIQISTASNVSSQSILELTNRMEQIRLGNPQRIQKIREFVTGITDIGISARLTAQQLRDLNRVAREVAAFGRVGQGGGGVTGLGRLNNITGLGAAGGFQTKEIGGREVPDFQKILGEPGVLGNIPGGARSLESVQTALKKYGTSLDKLTGVHIDQARGIVRWTAAVDGVPGAVNNATIVTNKWGGVLQSTQKQFRTFGSAIVRDVGEILKWGIAAAVVYAPVRALGDLMRQTTEIENKLADAQIALGSSAESLNLVWEDATIVARQLGVDVNGVIDGYVLAFRATGNIADPTERAAVATGLLRDSMLLAKLAGIEQALALDTLVGALRQTNTPLDEGVTLLDKWVAVSKVANVSIATLAESFAITSTAAENVGLSVDQLNGFIAAVGEVTTLSATESGNAVRAFISGIQTDKAEGQLRKFGISVKDVDGALRSFNDIFEDIVGRRDAGLLGDTDLAKIAEVVGGGARRGAQVNALLKNYGRVQELAAVSADANGDAADALAIKMNTLQSALKNLSNSFAELSRTVGTDGGFLDLIKLGVEGLTALADTLSNIVKLLGSATPALLTFTGAFALFRNSQKIQSFFNPFLNRAIIGGQQGQAVIGGITSGGVAVPSSFTGKPQPLTGVSGFLADRGLGRGTTFRDIVSGTGGQIAGGAGLGALFAIDDIFGDDQNLAKAGATIGASIIGILIGGPIGAVVGASMAQAFLQEVEVDIDSLRLTLRRAEEGTLGVSVELDAEDAAGLAEEVKAVLEQTFGILYTSTVLGTDITQPRNREIVANLAGVKDPDSLTRNQVRDLVERQILLAISGEELDFDFNRTGVSGFGKSIFATAIEAGEDNPELRKRAKEILKALEEALVTEAPDFGSVFIDLLAKNLSGIKPQISGSFSTELAERRQLVGRGQLGVRQLREFQDLRGTIENEINLVVTALGESLSGRLAEADIIALILDLEEEERDTLIDTANAYGRLTSAVEEWNEVQGEDIFILRERSLRLAEANRLQNQLAEDVELLSQGRTFRAFEEPDRLVIGADVTDEQIQEAIRKTRIAQQNLVNAATLDPIEAEKIKEGWGDLFLQIGEEFNKFTELFEDIDPSVARDIFKQEGLLDVGGGLSVQLPDITSSQFNEAFAANKGFYDSLVSTLRPLDEEDLGFIFKDNVATLAHADALVIQLILRDIKELNEDQLEGIFNIPEGVTALIPFTGNLFFSDQPIARDADFPNIIPAVENVESAIDLQTNVLGDNLLTLINLQEGRDAMLIEELRARDEPLSPGTPLEAVEELTRIDPRRGVGLGTPIDSRFGVGEESVLFPSEPSGFERWMQDTGLGPFLENLINTLAPSSIGRFQGAEEFNQQRDPRSITGTLGLENFGPTIREILETTLPQSIPVTINTRITNPVSIHIDGRLIQQAVQERSFQDLGSATRRAGALGYIQE